MGGVDRAADVRQVVALLSCGLPGLDVGVEVSEDEVHGTAVIVDDGVLRGGVRDGGVARGPGGAGFALAADDSG